MTVSLPQANIVFKKLAQDFGVRSERGNAIIIVKDDTSKTFEIKKYTKIDELESNSALYTADNLQAIRDVFEANPYLVYVIRVDVDKTVTDATTIIGRNLSDGWVALADSDTPTDNDLLVTWVKDQRDNKKKKFRGIVYKPTTTPNHEGVVELSNEKVTFADTRGEVTGDKFIPTLLGYLTSANVTKGTTYLKMENLKSVQEPADIEATLNLGKLTLINDENLVKIGLGINTLTTFTGDKKEDLRYIEIVEAQDLMVTDIRNNFKNNYIGAKKNTLDNQILFISATNTYLSDLGQQDVLERTATNKVDIDIDTQRNVWKLENPAAADWDDTKVKNTPYRNKLYLKGQVRILFSITDLQLEITY